MNVNNTNADLSVISRILIYSIFQHHFSVSNILTSVNQF